MNLLSIRTHATKRSGRYDLVNPSTFADAGMDFYITAGQRWLNKRSALPRAFAHLSGTLASAAYAHTVANKFKELSSVTVDDGVNPSWTLTRKTLAELEDLYDAGEYTTPHYYAYASYRTLETASSATIANFVAYDWPADEDDRFDYSGIVVVPAADTEYTVRVSGLFLPLELSDDTDTNYWSEEYPELLIMATLRAIAVLEADGALVQYWENAIRNESDQIDFFHVENKEDAAVNRRI
jgi:hypothetical protein